MKLIKTITRNDSVRRILCWLGAQYIKLVYATGRWDVIGGDIPKRLLDQGRPFIVCFWHNRLLMMPYAWRQPHPFHMLISSHPDGQLIARTVAHFNFRTVAGSTTRGGTAALRTLLKLLADGACIGVTPDGPQGPRMIASEGAVNIARLAGAPIIPISYSISRRRVLRTWDRFIIALPFARGVIAWGEPIEVARDLDDAALEQLRRTVEDGLNAITNQADSLCGCPPIEPAATTEHAVS